MTEREYTHAIDFRYRENMGKREYLDAALVLSPEEEANVMWSRLEFSMNPLLCEGFFKEICLEDRLKIIKASNPRNLWWFARLRRLEITANAIKPCRAGSEGVEIADRNVILKKHITYLKEQSAISNEQPRKPYCLVVNDDRVPTLPVFSLNDHETKDFLLTCFGGIVVPSNTAGIAVPNPWHQQMKSRSFERVYKWKNRIDIVPYMLLPRSVWNCPDDLNWRGIFSSEAQYKKNDAVSHEMHYYVSLHDNYYQLLGLQQQQPFTTIESNRSQLEQAFLTQLHRFDPWSEEIEQLYMIYEVLSNDERRAKYDLQVKNLQNSKFWQLLKQNTVHLLQVVSVMPISQHNSIYGTPTSPADEPCTFQIAKHPEERFYDTWETFYISNENLFYWLQAELVKNNPHSESLGS